MTVLPELLAVAAAAVALLWGCGLPLARLLLPRHHLPLLPLVAPFVGLALISALGHWSGALGGTLLDVRWPAVALAAAGWILVIADRRLRRFPRSSALALLVCLLAFLLAAVPLFALGYLTTVGGTIDGLSYAVRSEYLQESPPVYPELEAGKPWLGWVHSQIRLIRIGDVYFVGLLGLLTGRRSYELLSVVPALFFALTAGALFVWTRASLRFPRKAALLAALLVGISNLLLWPVYDNFLSQTMAVSLMPVAICFGVEGERRPGWRTAALFGLLLGALVSVYPVYAVYALGGILACWGAAWLLRPRGPRGRALGRAALWWLGASACAAAWNGPAFARAVPELGFVSQLLAPGGAQSVGGGNILVFPPAVEVLGLVAHAAAAYGEAMRRGPLALLILFGAALAALALFGWWRLGPRARLAAAAVLLTSLAFTAQQRWGVNAPLGYPYGWFKAVSALAPQVLALTAAGIFALWRIRSRRWLAVAAGLLLVGINLKHSLWTQQYVLQTRIVLDRELIEAAQATAGLDPAEWLFLDLSQDLRQHWLGYLLRDRRIRFRERLWIGHIPTPGESKAFFRYALVDRRVDGRRREAPADHPWSDPASYSHVWGEGRYELRKRRDSTVASVFWDRRWPDGEAVALGIVPAAGKIAASLGAEVREIGLGQGTPRTVQIRLVSVGTGTRLAVKGIGRPLELAPGSWLVDLDLGCTGAGRVAVEHTEGDTLLSDVRVLAAATGEPGACVETSPLRAGAAYMEQRLLDGGRVRVDAVVVRPQDSGGRVYRLGLHIIDPAQQKMFGVWSLDFPPGEQVRRGSLELDLRNRSSTGEIDGQSTALVSGSFDVESGSFQGDYVWWQLNPIEQIVIEPGLWFQRSAGGAAEVSRAVASPLLKVLPPP